MDTRDRDKVAGAVEVFVDEIVSGTDLRESARLAIGGKKDSDYRGNQRHVPERRFSKMLRKLPWTTQLLTKLLAQKGMTYDRITQLLVAHANGEFEDKVVTQHEYDASDRVIRTESTRQGKPSLKALQYILDRILPQEQIIKHTGQVAVDLSAAFRQAPATDAHSLVEEKSNGL